MHTDKFIKLCITELLSPCLYVRATLPVSRLQLLMLVLQLGSLWCLFSTSVQLFLQALVILNFLVLFLSADQPSMTAKHVIDTLVDSEKVAGNCSKLQYHQREMFYFEPV